MMKRTTYLAGTLTGRALGVRLKQLISYAHFKAFNPVQ